MIEGEARAEVAIGGGASRGQGAAARRRAATEMLARHEATLKRTARRYSLDGEDVEDAFQRTLEIVLTKAPTTDPRELIRWTQTVIKHEALAVRRQRERLLGVAPGGERSGLPNDPIALLPARGDGPDEQAERREDMARTREALQSLKPAELRALTLLAEGYSYAEISDISGFSLTKVNRCLSEGRERFRSVFFSSESGHRCRELRPLLSAFCDGEAGESDAALVREHLRACAHCRATLRAYRTAPRLAAALVPMVPVAPSLLARLRGLVSGAGTKAGAAKLLVCAGVAGSAAAGMATGVLPSPVATGSRQASPGVTGHVTRSAKRATEPKRPPKAVKRRHAEVVAPETPAPQPAAETPPPETATAPPAPAPQSSAPSGSAAGEFGP